MTGRYKILSQSLVTLNENQFRGLIFFNDATMVNF